MSRRIAGIFVNSDGGVPYAKAIVQGYKPIETRSRDMLSKLHGQTVAVVQTRRGKHPVVVGYANLEKLGFVQSGPDWEALREETLIPPGSRYDAHGKGKWCYLMRWPTEEQDPYALPENTIYHGRSWCEFDLDDISPID